MVAALESDSSEPVPSAERSVRLARGTTYGVNASLGALRGPAPIEVEWRSDPDGTGRSVQDMLAAIEQMRTSLFTGDSLDSAKQTTADWGVDAGDTNADNLKTLAQLAGLNLPVDQYKGLIARFKAVTPEDIRRVALKYLDINHMVLVIAGDATRLAPVVENLNLGKPEIRQSN